MCCKARCVVRWTSSDLCKWRNVSVDISTEKGCNWIIWYNEFEFTPAFTMLTLSRATFIQVITDISFYLAGKNTLTNSMVLISKPLLLWIFLCKFCEWIYPFMPFLGIAAPPNDGSCYFILFIKMHFFNSRWRYFVEDGEGLHMICLLPNSFEFHWNIFKFKFLSINSLFHMTHVFLWRTRVVL